MFVRSSKKKAAGDLRAPESTLVSSFNWKNLCTFPVEFLCTFPVEFSRLGSFDRPGVLSNRLLVHLSRGIFVHLSRGIFKYPPRETFSYVEGF